MAHHGALPHPVALLRGIEVLTTVGRIAKRRHLTGWSDQLAGGLVRGGHLPGESRLGIQRTRGECRLCAMSQHEDWIGNANQLAL